MKRILLLIAFLGIQTFSFAQSPQAQRIWEIAQSFNWTTFKNNTFTIGIRDDKALYKELSDFLKGKQIAGKPIDVQKFAYNYQVKPVNMVFIGETSTSNTFIDDIKSAVSKGGFPCLVITAKAKMLEDGSHINLIQQGAKYEVNAPEIQKVGLSFNPAKMSNGIVKSVQVKPSATNDVKLSDLKDKIEKTLGGDDEPVAKKEKKGKRGEAGKDKSPQEMLLEKAATDKGISDKQNASLKSYIAELEKMLDANKIDYQALKKKYEKDQAEAEAEIEDLNLTLIELDSLHKKDSLLAYRKVALLKSESNLAKANSATNFYIALAAAILAFFSIAIAFLAYRDRQIIAREKQKSESLLLNILPIDTAQELKEKGFAVPKQYELATVLFTDFKGFTGVAEKMSPEEIIQELDKCFLAFDEIAEKHNMERIKTIGDSYMCAGGVPKANKTNPMDAVRAGIEIQAFMKQLKAQRVAEGKPYFECRLGIHSGKVVAGVVGKKKFAYDIWGDTVNIASRMESSGEVNEINISADTYNLVKDTFKFEHRGKVNAKGKGEVDMYFVKE